MTRRDWYTSVPLACLLFLGGALFLLLIKTLHLPALVRSGAILVAELTPGHDEPGGDVFNILQTHPLIQASSVQFISKDEASSLMLDEMPEIGQLGPENPFLDIYTFKVKQRFHAEEHLRSIEEALTELKGVNAVYYQHAVTPEAEKALGQLAWIIIVINAILLIVIGFFLVQTVSTRLREQKDKIRLMDLAGATRSFILRPFLTESIKIVLISVSLGGALFVLMTTFLNAYYLENGAITIFEVTLSLIFITVLGLAPAGIGTYIMVNVYLREFYQSA